MAGVDSLSASLASGYKINTASDDASGLMITEQMKSQTTGYEVGADNAAAGQDVLNIAEGSLSTMTDSLQRLRELSLQAQNSALYTSTDLQAMQDETNQLLQGISDAAKGTQFNTMSLLDGSMADMKLATNPNGSGQSIQMVNATLDSLGLSGLDITSADSLKAIDSALETISSSRATIGAQSNALDHTIAYNNYADYNLTSAISSKKDTEYGKATSEKQKQNVLDAMQIAMQKKKEEQKRQQMENFFL